MTSCELCDLVRGSHQEPPLLDAGPWVVHVLPGFEVDGWLAVIARRHVVGLAGLDDAEASTLGATLRSVVAAAESVTGAPRSYIMALGERYEHWHALVAPVPGDLPPEDRGLPHLASAAERRDVARARRTAVRVRSRLDGVSRSEAVDPGG